LDWTQNASAHIFSHPDCTVGLGIAPNQLALADFTAGQELHLASKKGELACATPFQKCTGKRIHNPLWMIL